MISIKQASGKNGEVTGHRTLALASQNTVTDEVGKHKAHTQTEDIGKMRWVEERFFHFGLFCFLN